ncbi:MAG: envelope stress response membrane protein PspB [Acetobacteraceae bacterium]
MHIAGTLLGILLLVVVAPIWIVAHYATRWRTARVLSRDQERILAELHENARRMEDRMDSLERILDSEAPGWRGKAGSPWTGAQP